MTFVLSRSASPPCPPRRNRALQPALPDAPAAPAPAPTPQQQAALQQASLGQEIAFNEALIEERDRGIQEIQQTISEVNEIFRDLAVIVREQGQQVDDLEANLIK